MATNTSQSLTSELAEGMSDGTYKKITTDRGGNVDPATWEARKDLNDAYFGIHEARLKTLGDGTQHLTPDFVETPVVGTPASFFQ